MPSSLITTAQTYFIVVSAFNRETNPATKAKILSTKIGPLAQVEKNHLLRPRYQRYVPEASAA